MTEKSLAVTPRKQLSLLGDNFELRPNALIVHGQPTEAEYDEAFRRLSFIEGATSWWYGDLANAREKDYGSLKELAEKYGKGYGALAECQRVAKAYEVSSRLESLGFKHHQIATPLEDRLEWLQRAIDEPWTARELDNEIKKDKRNKERDKYRTNADFYSEDFKLYAGDFKEVTKQFPDNSIDHIITDPPYGAEYLDLWSSLAQIANRILVPSGFCICYSGTLHLDEVFKRLSAHLTYYWTNVLLHTGPIQGIKARHIDTGYKPIVVFAKEPVQSLIEFISDIIKGTGRDKSLHQWAQSEGEAEHLITRFTLEGDLILDPFAGTGTIMVACKRTGRLGKAIDVDANDIEVMRGRLMEVGESD